MLSFCISLCHIFVQYCYSYCFARSCGRHFQCWSFNISLSVIANIKNVCEPTAEAIKEFLVVQLHRHAFFSLLSSGTHVFYVSMYCVYIPVCKFTYLLPQAYKLSQTSFRHFFPMPYSKMCIKRGIVALGTISWCLAYWLVLFTVENNGASHYFNPERYRFVTDWEFGIVEGDNTDPRLHCRF